MRGYVDGNKEAAPDDDRRHTPGNHQAVGGYKKKRINTMTRSWFTQGKITTTS